MCIRDRRSISWSLVLGLGSWGSQPQRPKPKTQRPVFTTASHRLFLTLEVAAMNRVFSSTLAIAMLAIINEASGERAMHHIMEFVPYVRVRPIDEYKGHFRESEAMVNFAKQYGYSTAEIESFPTTNLQFQATQAELWM